ncbi:glycoside hydrolase family 43 protein [Sporormia fimetaria CBS 119925]|uniref:Arabinan endo-1,5-alpha-L-arabinosidase n=1 Tax=Sporormia fimetaria CBS 119925 TaxID=1340428 RepID=A0A6A6VKC6_9PLEO|nr:glycoside hydrolase family 43 protein [Sporormia fimetaria CBS 119925]
MRAFTFILALVVPLVYGYANPMSCTGECNNAHDPALIRRSSDGTYFRFATGGKIAIHSAPSINGPWAYRGAAIPNGSKIDKPGRNDLWVRTAPDVAKVGDTYYLYYSVSTFGSQDSAIGVATSPSLDAGTWTDHGATGIASSPGKPYNAIDSNLVRDGSNYLISFGSFWNNLYQVKMADPPKKTAQGATSVNIAYTPEGEHAQEAAFLYKHADWWYLFFSVGRCCGYDVNRPADGQEYRVLACRSRSVGSGFVDKNGKACLSGGGTAVLRSHDFVYGPGGQGVWNDPSLGPVLYYHYVDTRIGYADAQKQFGVNKIDFSSGWPVV